MRIAHLIWSLGVGGAQTLLTDIVNIQIKEGHEVGIFVIDSLVDDSIKNKIDHKVQIFYMERIRGNKSLLPFIHLNWTLWKYKPDIIHSHSGKIGKAIFSSIPKVVTIHNMTSSPHVCKGYKATYAISQSVKDDWSRKGFDVTAVIENGVSCDSIKQKKNWNQEDTIHVVVLSRIRFSPKRQDLVLLALNQLISKTNHILSKENIKNCIVHFIGDGEDVEQLMTMVRDNGLENNVVFEGLRDRDWVYKHLCDFDLFLQPSDYEGFGLTVAEACAAKLPVLVSNVDGPLEIIDGGRLGMVFKKGDADDLAQQLETFIKGGYDYTLIEKAYLRTKQRYSIEKTVHQYLNEYRKVLRK